MKKKGFTLIELLVVIAIIAMLLAILMPALNKVKKIAQRVVCGTNLKGLGTAQVVYANDYEDAYAVAGHGLVKPSDNNITAMTGGFDNPGKPVASWANGASVGASLYLLVREADVSPKSFVCPSGGEDAWDGEGLANVDITEAWDFGYPDPAYGGTGPIKCLSYSYQHPYTRFAADGTKSAAFAVMSDKNPWHDPKLPNPSGGLTADNASDRVHYLEDDWNGATVEKWRTQAANAQPHDRDGQNIMYGDGHNAYEKRSDVGVRHDNIFTPQGGPVDKIRQGQAPSRTDRNTDVPANPRDSYLVNDDRL